MALTGEKLKVCILAGGLGRRLRSVAGNIPKPMVPIGDKPFLHLLMEHFGSLGFSRFVLAVGHLWERIKDYFSDGSAFGWEIEYSVEPEPMGTGGAVLWAKPLWGSRALIANGDTFLAEDWRELVRMHHACKLPATMALARQDRCDRFGKVEVQDGRVVGFAEKKPDSGEGWINAGVYMLDEEVLAPFDRGERFSLEEDIFPRLVGSIAAYTCNQSFADIGTPESLEAFRDISVPPNR